ncbi:hypothetical protein Nizo1839_0547 [Lactiplantibacillus plantarum]|uniref:hypothetical protein n=1 Tax=Lactiplantibacillus plantarum TaxID=1590 RepID=UPI00073CA238|nr:hypothetical protein [Lactiplantibacillus plantarum]KTF02552.1 hypothetical protein SF2A35B_0788 [Lactiplantibacillus plantarum]KZT82910.1 hypothetical protein Nizo1839_0547 [Lactiplantibacillus plantarum]WNC20941.1 hypothetical protein RIF09_15480 [Lactiplantibacillus plantarum]
MAVKIVTELFGMFDGELIDFNSFDNLPQVPFLLIRFRVRSNYYAETQDGKIILRRKYQRQFNKIRYQFIDKFLPVFDNTDTSDLELINQIVPWLKEKLTADFLVTDNIELNSIELVGDWAVFVDDSTSLAKEEADEIRATLFKDQ